MSAPAKTVYDEVNEIRALARAVALVVDAHDLNSNKHPLFPLVHMMVERLDGLSERVSD